MKSLFECFAWYNCNFLHERYSSPDAACGEEGPLQCVGAREVVERPVPLDARHLRPGPPGPPRRRERVCRRLRRLGRWRRPPCAPRCRDARPAARFRHHTASALGPLVRTPLRRCSLVLCVWLGMYWHDFLNCGDLRALV